MDFLKSFSISMKNQAYNSMCEEGYDNKIPLHNDEAFQHGIQYKIKFIGSLEVIKPSSRSEIISAMRRIRYEFKARSVKKRSVNLTISVDGINISSYKKNKKNYYSDQDQTNLMQYPIYRVFYVSHDSQDLKIFSFIARDHTTNTFRCNVFKAYKKNEAIHIVRTIGQAFEVCHKLSLQETQENKTLETKRNSIEKPDRYLQSVQIPISSANNEINLFPQTTHLSSEFTLKHQMQYMQEQLQQMENESDITLNQIKLIKEQLNIEIAARIDAQNKNKQLIDRNRELLIHIQQLLVYSNELERKCNQTCEPLKNLPSRPMDLLLPTLFSTLSSSTGISNQQDFSSNSSDSGKGKEISSENICEALLTNIHDQQINHSWNINNNKCPSIHDDITSQSIAINENISKINKYEEYSSTSTSCSSINKNPIEHYIYDHIIPTGLSSFTNSAFTESPLRIIKN